MGGAKPAVTLRLLDGVHVTVGGRTTPLTQGAARLVARVALSAPRAVLRSTVATSLWPDLPEHRSMANVRASLSRVRQRWPSLVEASPTTLALGAQVTLDIDDPLAHVDLRGRGALPSMLPGWDDEWVVLDRERVRQRILHDLDVACEAHLACGRTDAAIDLGLYAIAAEPLRESTYEIVLRAHIAEGNLCEASRLLLWYERLAMDEYGITPAAELYELIDDATGRRRPGARSVA